MLRLSEAIRLGSTMKPQGFFGFHPNGGTQSCALGAAGDAIGITLVTIAPLPKEWCDLNRIHPLPPCPVDGCSGVRITFLGTIAHLNDDHRWTRERIADWVELHEPLPQPEKETLHEEEAACNIPVS